MHFLYKRETNFSPLHPSRVYAAVKVEVTKKAKPRTLAVLPGGIVFTKTDTKFVPLPDDVIVVNDEGEEITASFKFYVSLETFDPFHIVVDAPPDLFRY